MAVQPTRRNDLYFALVQVMLPEEYLTSSELSRRLKLLKIPYPIQLIADAVDKRLLVEGRSVQNPASGYFEALLRYARSLPESCPAPLFYEPLRRRAGLRPYDEPQAAPPKRATPRSAAGIVYPSFEEPRRPHPKADAAFSYFLTDQSSPYRAITLRQLHECITRAPSELQAFTQAAALVSRTRYFPPLSQLQDSVVVGGIWEPGGGVTSPSHLGAFRLQLEPDRGGWDAAQQALLTDEYLREALLLAYAGPTEHELTLVVELNPECLDYAAAMQQYLGYLAQRYATSGMHCLQAVDSQSISHRVSVWHDPQAYLLDALR